MDQLPQECFDHIVSLLDVFSLGHLSVTCHYSRNFVLSPRYWQYIDVSGSDLDNSTSTSNVTYAYTFWTYLAHRFGYVVKIIKLKKIDCIRLKPLVNQFSALQQIICDEEDREISEIVVINRMIKTAKKMLDAIHNQEKHNDSLFIDLQVRQARALLWDALWIVLANKHEKKYVLNEEKHFTNIYHDNDWTIRIIELLIESERLMRQPSNLFPGSIIVPARIEALSFITDPRDNKTYLAIGIERRILLWDTDTLQCVRVFDTTLALNKKSYKLKNSDEWAQILVQFTRNNEPIIIGGAPRRYFCWNFDTAALISEKKFEPTFCFTPQFLFRNETLLIQSNSLGCLIIDPYTGQLLQELPEVFEARAYTKVTANGKFIVIEKHGKKKDYTLNLTIRDIFSNTEEKYQISGLYRTYYVQSECHSLDDELIAVSSPNWDLLIYGRSVNEKNEVEYKEIQSIKLPYIRNLIRFLSRELILAGDEIYNFVTGKLVCSVKVEPYTFEQLPFAFDEKSGLFAKAQHKRVAILRNVFTEQQLVESPHIVPDKFTQVKDTLIFHETVSFDPESRNEDPSHLHVRLKIRPNDVPENKALPYHIDNMGLFDDFKGILVDVTQDQYGLEHVEVRGEEKFQVVDMDTKTVLWQYNIESKFASERLYANTALFVPQTNQVIVSNTNGGFTLFDWKENRPIIALENKAFGSILKLSQSGVYCAMMTIDASRISTLVYNRINKSQFLLDVHCIACDFNPTNEHQVAVAGCGVDIFDLKSKIRIKKLTRYIDGQVKVLRESEEIPLVKYSPSGKYLAVIELPSRKPWGLNVAPSILRVFETHEWTMITSLDLGDAARALHWLDDEYAVIGYTHGKVIQMRIVVPEFAHLFKYLIPPDQGEEKPISEVHE